MEVFYMKIQIDEKGSLNIDGIEKTITELKSEFLEKLVNDSLEGKIIYEILGDTPLANFFKQIQKETSEESELKKMIDDNSVKKKELKEEQVTFSPKYN